MLVCPKCQSKLERVDRIAKCSNGHCFDYAKERYLNLLLKNSKNHGDNKEMVLARRHFLEHGYYQPLANAIIEELVKIKPTSLLDLGCGEGYYTSQMANALQAHVYGNDVSKEAIRLASKTNPKIQYFIASSSQLPLASNSIDVATCLFSFYDLKETSRILKQGGKLIIVSPGPKHLFELKEHVYDTPYLNEVKRVESDLFTKHQVKQVTYSFEIDNTQDIKELFQMTPYAFKTKSSDRAKLDTLSSLTLTADFMIQIFTK